jgi:hypothetical protein
MGVYRRDEQIKELNTTAGRFVVRSELDDAQRTDEQCWFCGLAVDADAQLASDEGAVLTIEPFGAGEAVRGVCHVECAERARGSVAS